MLSDQSTVDGKKINGGVEHGFIRRIPGTVFISLLTAPLSIPFELAKNAYYADKTFP